MESAQISYGKYSTTNPTLSVAKLDQEQDVWAIAVTKESWKCYFCGSLRCHSRSNCHARNKTCNKCGKVGHFVKVCKSSPLNAAIQTSVSNLASVTYPTLAAVSSAIPLGLYKAIIKTKINGHYYGEIKPDPDTTFSTL